MVEKGDDDMIIVVKDLYNELNVLCILQTKHTDADKIKELIDEVKAEYPEDYDLDDLLDILPDDVEVIEDKDSVEF